MMATQNPETPVGSVPVGKAPVPVAFDYYPGPGPGPWEPFEGAASADDLSRPLYGARFGQAVSRFFRGYVRFSGRASLSEFWYARLFVVVISAVCLVLLYTGLAMTGAFVSSDSRLNDPGQNPVGFALFVAGVLGFFAVEIAVALPTIAITWRRLHDANLAGPWWFLSPIFGGLIVLVLTLMQSKPAGRRFDGPRQA